MKNLKNNKKGSILVITTGFALIFTMLGIASIHYAGVQNEFSERMKSSSEAFWLADGAIEKAKRYVDVGTNDAERSIVNFDSDELNPGSFPPKNFTLNSEKILSFTWLVKAQGNVNNQSRAIEAQIRLFPGFGALNTNGPIKFFDDDSGECSFPSGDQIDCENVDAFVGFTFNGNDDGIFSNVNLPLLPVPTYSDAVPDSDPTHFSNLASLPLLPATTHITVINIANTANVQFPGSNPIQGSGFVYIDVNDANVNGIVPKIKIEIADFSGILWIAGQSDTRISGNGTFLGAIFAETTLEVSVVGNSTIQYDEDAILAATAGFGEPEPGETSIIAWKEVAPN